MFGVSIEWWILYILIIVITLVGLKILMNGVSILGAKLRDIRDNVKELHGPEILRELKEIKYILDGLESKYDGFILKERGYGAGDRK